jgi:hypothetical protein
MRFAPGAISLVAIACASPPVKVSPGNGAIDAGQVWRDFTNGLEEAGVEFLNDYPQPQSIDRAEGLRYRLQQVQSAALETLIRQPGEIPLLRNGPTTINKWGMDGADGKYMNVAIDSSGTYRFRGQLGTARLLAVQLATVFPSTKRSQEGAGWPHQGLFVRMASIGGAKNAACFSYPLGLFIQRQDRNPASGGCHITEGWGALSVFLHNVLV